MVHFSFNWSKLSEDLEEEMQDLIKRYQMFSKDILLERFEKELYRQLKNE